jgi:hypothetical protein
VNELKEQVRRLEAEYARVIGLQTVPTSSKPLLPHFTSSLKGNNNEVNALVDVYAQLTLQKEELRKENEALKVTALTHAKFQRLVSIVMEADMVRTIVLYSSLNTSSRSFRISLLLCILSF